MCGVQRQWRDHVPGAKRPTDRAIARVEQRLGFRFPEDYRQVLAAHAGQTPAEVEIALGAGTVVLNNLLHVGEEGSTHPDTFHMRALQIEDWADGVPGLERALIPIAAGPSQGVFCYDIRRGTARPPVVYVHFNFDPDEAGAIRHVADTFAELLGKLHTRE